MTTHCSDGPLSFEDIDTRKVVGAFDGGAITSNGGALLLREADRVIDLTRSVAACFSDSRDQSGVVHDLETLIAQRIFGLALGHEDLNDHDDLRHDPVLGLLSARVESKRSGMARLAGKSTLQRLETAASSPRANARYHKFQVDETALADIFPRLFIATHKKAPQRIILDLDATDDPLHGDQEGRFFHGYYRCYCYLPLYIFAGRHLLTARLRTADRDGADGALEEIIRLVAMLRQAWPGVTIWLRADSGFARDNLMTWCEENGVDYIFGLARNVRLQRRIRREMARARAGFEQTRTATRVFKSMGYRTCKSWSRRRRVVAKAEHLAQEARRTEGPTGKVTKGENPRFVVTSLASDVFKARQLYEDLYCARGEMENRIKECQLDLFADRTSAATLASNQLRLWFASLAYVLVDAVRRIALKDTSMARATCGTIRLKLLKIGAVVTTSVRRVKVAMASACPVKSIFALAHHRLRTAAA